jgi:hypothetical protein
MRDDIKDRNGLTASEVRRLFAAEDLARANELERQIVREERLTGRALKQAQANMARARQIAREVLDGR